MNASAKLKTGHILKSMKSTTKPLNTLSIKLPMMPENSITKKINALSGILSYTRIKTPIAINDIQINAVFESLNKPHKAPVFFTSVIAKILRSIEGFVTETIIFTSWSTMTKAKNIRKFFLLTILASSCLFQMISLQASLSFGFFGS